MTATFGRRMTGTRSLCLVDRPALRDGLPAARPQSPERSSCDRLVHKAAAARRTVDADLDLPPSWGVAAPDSLRPDFSFEAAAHKRGITAVCGVDEAGRGPLAGPVVAAAVILKPSRIPRGINDSKKLTAEARERLYVKDYRIVHRVGRWYRRHRADRERSTSWAPPCGRCAQAIRQLSLAPELALVDGNRLPQLACEATTRSSSGDARSLSIAAASIIAKVTRDRMMVKLALGNSRDMALPATRATAPRSTRQRWRTSGLASITGAGFARCATVPFINHSARISLTRHPAPLHDADSE